VNTSGAVPIVGQNTPENGDKNDDDALPEIPVRTAIVIYQDYDGQWVADNDPRRLNGIQVDKVAHPDEFVAGCFSVIVDVIAEKASAATLHKQIAMARQMQAQATNAAILNKLKQDGGIK